MNICESLTQTAKICPDAIAIVFEGQSFSYAQLDSLSRAAAAHLRDAGVHPTDRVAIMLPNAPAFPVWYYAILRIGAIAVSVSSRMASAEVEFVLADCGANALVTLPATIEAIRADANAAIPPCVAATIATCELGNSAAGVELSADDGENAGWFDADPNTAALILYTSGTTGFAKGATLSHANVRSNVAAFNHLCNQQPHDRVLLAVPLFHCFGQNALLNSVLNVGATLVIQRKFDLSEAKHLIAAETVTQLYGVPMMFQLLHDSCEPADLASVNYCFSAAAPLPIQVADRWQQKFRLPIYEGYGLTETSPFASYNHRVRFTPGSIGAPIDAVEMKIIDPETGVECPVGQLGEIAIRGPNVMLGYWNRPDDTAAAIKDGWFYSGDIGRQDETGFYFIVDRVKDMIAVGGMKVFPAEVERVLLDHAAVSDVAVVGFPDAVFGEQVIAFVVAAEEKHTRTAAEIKTFAQSQLANYKAPRHIVFLDELPRNPSGKILKKELRELSLTSLVGDSNSESGDADELGAANAMAQLRPASLKKTLLSTHLGSRLGVAIEFLQQTVRAISQSDGLPPPDARLLDAGLDSLMIVELSGKLQVEAEDDQQIPATLVFDYPRISELAEFLVESLTANPAAAATFTEPFVRSRAPEPIQDSVEELTEDEALQELMKELES